MAQTWSRSPTVNSSGELPPEDCPATSIPGVTVRATTSPSIGARRVTACETPPAPPWKSRARWRARASSAAARSRAACAASSSRCAAACASNSSRWRRSSRSAACRSASALPTSAAATPTSGDSSVTSGAPFLTRWPSCASMWLTRPVTGEKTWATCESSKAMRPGAGSSEATAHPVDQLAAGGECSVRGDHLAGELSGRLLSLDRLGAQVRLRALHLALLPVENWHRQRGADGDRGRRHGGTPGALLGVLRGQRHFGNSLPAREVECRAGARLLPLERAQVGPRLCRCLEERAGVARGDAQSSGLLQQLGIDAKSG